MENTSTISFNFVKVWQKLTVETAILSKARIIFLHFEILKGVKHFNKSNAFSSKSTNFRLIFRSVIRVFDKKKLELENFFPLILKLILRLITSKFFSSNYT